MDPAASDFSVIPDIFPDPETVPIPATAGDDAKEAFSRHRSGRSQPMETDPQLLGGTVPVARMMEITEAACKRIDDCRSEMGLHFGQPLAGELTWAWERQIARIMYQGNMEHRRAMGGVFLDNNWSMNIPSRIVRMLAAQHSGDLVGSDPFCAVMPEKVDAAATMSPDSNIEATPAVDAECSESLPDESPVDTAGDASESDPLYAANRQSPASSSPPRGQFPRSYVDPGVQGMTPEQAKDHYERWIGERMNIYDANKEFLTRIHFEPRMVPLQP